MRLLNRYPQNIPYLQEKLKKHFVSETCLDENIATVYFYE